MRVFVYGTLKRAYQSPLRIWPHAPLAIEEATLDGATLFHASRSYPGMKTGEDTILGEVWTIAEADAEETLKALDRYEGCSESPNSLYARREVEVTTYEGRAMKAWAYFFLGVMHPDSYIAPIGNVAFWGRD